MWVACLRDGTTGCVPREWLEEKSTELMLRRPFWQATESIVDEGMKINFYRSEDVVKKQLKPMVESGEIIWTFVSVNMFKVGCWWR